jgi:predicted nucleic acid-binding protein
VRGGAELLEYGEPCMCAITRMEILYSTRSAEDFATLQDDLSAYQQLPALGEAAARTIGTWRRIEE